LLKKKLWDKNLAKKRKKTIQHRKKTEKIAETYKPHDAILLNTKYASG
jgi:hypothetical protein